MSELNQEGDDGGQCANLDNLSVRRDRTTVSQGWLAENLGMRSAANVIQLLGRTAVDECSCQDWHPDPESPPDVRSAAERSALPKARQLVQPEVVSGIGTSARWVESARVVRREGLSFRSVTQTAKSIKRGAPL